MVFGRTVKAAIQIALAQITRFSVPRLSIRRLIRLGVIPTAVWRRLPLKGAFRISFENSASFVMMSTPDNHFVRALYWFGGEWKEPETVPTYCNLARHARAIVDVGASQGFYTLLGGALNPKAELVAYEPHPHVYQILHRNVASNNLAHRCRVVGAAVGRRSGRELFYLPPNAIPSHGRLHSLGPKGPIESITEVDVVSLDEEFGTRSDIDLMKIDVEGGELDVLEGMVGLLKRSRPNIIIEALPGESNEDVSDILIEHGYSFWHLTRDLLVPSERLMPDEARKHRNYLCVHHDRLESVSDVLPLESQMSFKSES